MNIKSQSIFLKYLQKTLVEVQSHHTIFNGTQAQELVSSQFMEKHQTLYFDHILKQESQEVQPIDFDIELRTYSAGLLSLRLLLLILELLLMYLLWFKQKIQELQLLLVGKNLTMEEMTSIHTRLKSCNQTLNSLQMQTVMVPQLLF